MDGSEFLGDMEGSQGSLLSCSPSATSLDIDGWFSYLAAQEGARPPQRPVLLQPEDDPAEVLEVRTLAPTLELSSQETKHDVFAEDAFLMDHFEDWHAQDLEKILARGTTVQGELPVAVIDLHQDVEEPPETKPNAGMLEQAEAEAIREMMDEVRHKQEAPAPRGETHATGVGGSVVDDNNYDDVDMDFVKEEGDVEVDIDVDVDVDVEEDYNERADGVEGADSPDRASMATKDGRRQSLTGRRRWRRSLDGSSFSSPFSSPQPTSPTSASSAAAATTSASTSSSLSPSNASSPNRLVVKMRRVGQGLRVSGPATDEPSAASLGATAEKEPAASTTATAAPSSSRTTSGGKKQPTSASGGKGLVSPAKRKDGVLKKVQGYTLFCQEVRERIVSENEGMPFRELQKKYGEAWRALDKAEKDAYAAQADELNREAEAAAAAEEAALRAAAEEERRRRNLERKEQLVLEKRRQEEEQERKILEKTTGKMARRPGAMRTATCETILTAEPRVIPRLYLGSKHVAGNEAWMQQANCTHVLNVSAEVRNFFEKRGDVTYHRIRVSDDGTQKIDKFFEEGTDFIHRVIGRFVTRKYVDKANLAAITPAAAKAQAPALADTSASESGAPEPMVVESQSTDDAVAAVAGMTTKTEISGEERMDPMKIENDNENDNDKKNEESAETTSEAKVEETDVVKTEEGKGGAGEARDDEDGGVNGPSVLVHCSEGRSRSPTLLIAYLMRYAKWSLKRAYEHLANLSSNLNINDGFKQQLMNYERTIHSLETPSIDFFQRTLRTVRRAVSLGGKSGPALSALSPPSATSLAFTSPMVSRKRPPPRSAATAAAAAPTTMDDVPSFIATSPSSPSTKMRRQSTGSSHHTPAARSSPSTSSARLPSFTPPIPVKRKRIINRKICDEELTVQKKIDSYFASPAPSSSTSTSPLFAPPTHPSSKRKASAAAQAAAKRRRQQQLGGGSTSDETDVPDHPGGGEAVDARDHDDDDEEDEEKENRKVTNNKRGRSASLEGAKAKAAGGKRPKRRRDDYEDDDDEDESESESDEESEDEDESEDDDDDEVEYGKKKRKPKKKPAGKKVRGKKGATTPKKARKTKAASTPKAKTAPGTKDADRVQEVVSPDLGSITILYPFDEETVKSWSSARLSAWKLRHENANAYYYRFEDPVVKQSHRASTTEQKQENHEAFMARYDEFVREGWIIGTAWGLFSKAVPGFVGYQCANYYRKLVKDGNLEDRSYTTDEKGDLKKVQRASSKGENETLNNQLNDVWRTPEVKWIESCVSKWVTKYHAKGAEKAKGTPRKMKKGGKNDD